MNFSAINLIDLVHGLIVLHKVTVTINRSNTRARNGIARERCPAAEHSPGLRCVPAHRQTHVDVGGRDSEVSLRSPRAAFYALTGRHRATRQVRS